MTLLQAAASLPRCSPQPEVKPDAALGDLRFRALLSDADWERLPLPVRRRFSQRLAATETAVFVGVVTDIWMSRAGWLLAQAARLIGAPLPTSRDTNVPSI